MMRVERFGPERWDDFLAVHHEAKGAGACRCVAWWVESWEGWLERSAEENLALRESLCARGEYDGYLAYDGARPIGWCQVGPRDRLIKLARQFELEPDPSAWAITCFQIDPDHRRRGVARALLEFVLADLPERGARTLEAFPKRGEALEEGELWNGPAALFRSLGFETARTGPVREVLVRVLETPRA